MTADLLDRITAAIDTTVGVANTILAWLVVVALAAHHVVEILQSLGRAVV